MSPDFERLRLNIATNAQHNILRACVISADRLISSLSANDLSDYISQNRLDELLENMQEESTDLSSHLADALTRFPDSERTRKQGEVVRKPVSYTHLFFIVNRFKVFYSAFEEEQAN